jgi:hypothetical protein
MPDIRERSFLVECRDWERRVEGRNLGRELKSGLCCVVGAISHASIYLPSPAIAIALHPLGSSYMPSIAL